MAVMITWAGIKTWLTDHSDFMNEVGFLATMGHIAWPAFGLVTLALLSNCNIKICIWISIVFVIAAALKEFLYDANIERPKQSTRDNVGDFAGYLGGIVLAWIVIAIQLHRMKG